MLLFSIYVMLYVFNNHFNIRHFFCLKLPSLGACIIVIIGTFF